MINQKIDKMILETITERSYEEVKDWYEDWEGNQTRSVDVNGEMEHPSVGSPDELVAHLREMISEGYTDEQIKQLHPELAQLFNRGE